MAFVQLGDVHWFRVGTALAMLALASRDIDLGVDFGSLFQYGYVKGLIVLGVALSATRTHLPSTVAAITLALFAYPFLPKATNMLSGKPSDPGAKPGPNIPAPARPETVLAPAADRLAAAEERAREVAPALSPPRAPRPLPHVLRASSDNQMPRLPPSPFF